MKKTYKVFYLLICILILPLVLNSQEIDSNIHETTLHELRSYLTKRGYNAEALFSDPKFEIYDDIDDFFKNPLNKTATKNTATPEKQAAKRKASAFLARNSKNIKYTWDTTKRKAS